jgi:hypothetical protein
VASLADYDAVRRLVADIIAEGVDAAVSATVKQTVRAVQTVLDEGADEATVAAVSKVLRLDKGSALRRVRAAIDLGYVRNLEEKRGRPARLVLGSQLPQDEDLLPDVERLQGCTANGGDEGVSVTDSEGEMEWEDLRV